MKPRTKKFELRLVGASRWLGALALTLLSGHVSAQLLFGDAEWQEATAPPPPALNLNALVPFDGPANSPLKFGVDPTTLQIGKDGVVRYVVVATSPSGTVNAMYEGIRCVSAQVKTYARHNPSSGWNLVQTPEWRSLYSSAPSNHSLRLASQGVCTGAAPASSVRDIVRALRSPGQNIVN